MSHPDTLTTSHVANDPDRQLIDAIAVGQVAALEQLYRQRGPELLVFLQGYLGNRQEAEDLLQEVFVAVWKGAANFRGQSSVRTWLFAIARHRAHNARYRARPTFALDEATATAASDDAFSRSDEQLAMQATLRQLPAEQRTILELVFYHQLSGAEIAGLLEVPLGTVKSRLNRAKSALRRLLKLEETGDA